MIIFVDECSFSEKSLSKKIWSSDQINNFKYNNGRIASVSIMAAISNKEILQLKFNRGTNCAIDYYNFLAELKEKFMNNSDLKKLYKNKKITIILDNATIHTAKSIRRDIRDFKFNFLYLPCYSPQCNPIELVFSHFKRIKTRTVFKNV